MSEDAFVEDEDPTVESIGDQQGPIENRNPAIVSQTFSALISFLSSYGWFCLAAVIILWYLKSYLEEKLDAWQKQREDAEAHRTDSAEAMTRQEEILAARAKLQQKYDEIAAQHAEQQKMRDEELRKRQVEDWESHQRGGTSKATKERSEAMGGGGGFMQGGSGGTCRYDPRSRRQGKS